MQKELYKVLDVREYTHTMGDGAHMRSPQHVIVICEDVETKERKRFEFSKKQTYLALNHLTYAGYDGDWDKLIVGDIFTIDTNDSQNKVCIVNADTV